MECSLRRQIRSRRRRMPDRWLASMITDKSQGRWVDPRAGRVTLGAFADEWVRGKVGLAPKTCELYDYLLNHLILPALGDVELIDLTPARIRTWRAELLRAGRPGPSTIAKAYRLLSAMMVTAAIDNRIARNPCVEKGAGVERSPEMRMGTSASFPHVPIPHRAPRKGRVSQ